jgi:hypothetical protein
LFVQNIKINGCNRSGFKICKSINETLNLWAANANRRITCNEPMNPEGLLIVSELINAALDFEAIRYSKIIDGILIK